MIKDILKYTFEKLGQNYITRGIEQNIIRESKADFARQVCEMAFKMSNEDLGRYDLMIKDFMDLSAEYLILQSRLDKNEKYEFDNFGDVRDKILNNSEVMLGRYLNGVLLSQAFWSHSKYHDFFIEKFCSNDLIGAVLDVPVGTGFFLSEFMRLNPGWKYFGADLSPNSVQYAKKLTGLCHPGVEADIRLADVFELDESIKFDRIICSELMEHLEHPEKLMKKLSKLIKDDGKIYLTAAIWIAYIDHIYLFKSVNEVKEMIRPYFQIQKEISFCVKPGQSPDSEKIPTNFGCVLTKKKLRRC